MRGWNISDSSDCFPQARDTTQEPEGHAGATNLRASATEAKEESRSAEEAPLLTRRNSSEARKKDVRELLEAEQDYHQKRTEGAQQKAMIAKQNLERRRTNVRPWASVQASVTGHGADQAHGMTAQLPDEQLDEDY